MRAGKRACRKGIEIMRVAWKKVAAVVAAAAAITGASANLAWADNISNGLDGSVDAVAEVMALNPGGTGTTQLYVDPTNGDGKNGCNLTGDTTLVVDVASGDPQVATVTPSQVTFTSCVAINDKNLPTLNVTAGKAGSATITLSKVSNN